MIHKNIFHQDMEDGIFGDFLSIGPYKSEAVLEEEYSVASSHYHN
jgi:pentose-5-phosphate-3-epimerase